MNPLRSTRARTAAGLLACAFVLMLAFQNCASQVNFEQLGSPSLPAIAAIPPMGAPVPAAPTPIASPPAAGPAEYFADMDVTPSGHALGAQYASSSRTLTVRCLLPDLTESGRTILPPPAGVAQFNIYQNYMVAALGPALNGALLVHGVPTAAGAPTDYLYFIKPDCTLAGSPLPLGIPTLPNQGMLTTDSIGQFYALYADGAGYNLRSYSPQGDLRFSLGPAELNRCPGAYGAHLAFAPGGNVGVVTCQTDGIVYYRRLNAQGAWLDSEFREVVGSNKNLSFEDAHAVGLNALGQFAIVWGNLNGETWAGTFDADGTRNATVQVTNPIPNNTSYYRFQTRRFPIVAGDFIVLAPQLGSVGLARISFAGQLKAVVPVSGAYAISIAEASNSLSIDAAGNVRTFRPWRLNPDLGPTFAAMMK